MKNLKISDEQLFVNIKQDDYSSYNQLFVRYYSHLCLFVNGMINNKSESEDIVQELFIKLWTDRKKLDIQNTISSYIYMVAKNMTLNYIRSETNRKAAIDNMAEQYLQEYDANDDGEFSLVLEECINQLPARCKEVILLHHVQDYKHKEIAESLNISIKTIKNQIWMSLRRLRSCLELKKYKI
jgi:RNA polymerase sigma-70 factor (ECF subfamily)